MTKIKKCPKCNADMETGFVVDHTNSTDKHVSEWAVGVPDKSFFFGVKAQVTIEIATYRCTGCGYLESYAY